MDVDGVAWLSRRVAPFLAPRFYSPIPIGPIITIVTALWRRDWFSDSLLSPLFLQCDQVPGVIELIGQQQIMCHTVLSYGLEKRNAVVAFVALPRI
jgi:hypothetical protein